MIFLLFGRGKWSAFSAILMVAIAIGVYELDRHGDNKSGIGVLTITTGSSVSSTPATKPPGTPPAVR